MGERATRLARTEGVEAQGGDAAGVEGGGEGGKMLFLFPAGETVQQQNQRGWAVFLRCIEEPGQRRA